MGRNPKICNRVISACGLQKVVAVIAAKTESGLAHTHRLREKRDLIRVDFNVGCFYQSVVELVIENTDGSSITPLAENMSGLHRPLEPLRSESSNVKRVIKETGKGQVQIRFIKPARGEVTHQSTLLQASNSGFKGDRVVASAKIETAHIK